MADNSNTFYCINCRSIKDRDDAETFFQTGFYNNTIPLGVCKSCNANVHGVMKEGEDTD